MKQATRISGPAPDSPVLFQLASDGFNLLRGWLKNLTLRLGAVVNAPKSRRDITPAAIQLTAYPATSAPPVPGVARKPATVYPATSAPPVPDVTRESQSEGMPGSFGLVGWLKHFMFYLGAVVAICLVGLFFLWQIPFLRDPSQLLKIMDDGRASRPLTPASPLVAPTAPIPAAPMPSPVNPAVDPHQPSIPTDAVVTATSPPAMPTDSAVSAQPPAESQPAAAPDDQTEPAAPPTEATAETVPPPPQTEIEQLLTDAQQQMENRRFTAPASGNALSTYQRILELQPDHPVAIEGIQRITTYYRDIAQQSLQQGRLDESLAYINRGLRATPQNEPLLSLRRQVQQAQRITRQREQEERQKQAALEEMQRQRLERMQREPLRRPQEQQQPWWRQPSNYNDNSGFNQR